MWAIAAVTWSDDVRLHAPGSGHGASFPVSEPRAPRPRPAGGAGATTRPCHECPPHSARPSAPGQSSVGRSPHVVLARASLAGEQSACSLFGDLVGTHPVRTTEAHVAPEASLLVTLLDRHDDSADRSRFVSDPRLRYDALRGGRTRPGVKVCPKIARDSDMSGRKPDTRATSQDQVAVSWQSLVVARGMLPRQVLPGQFYMITRRYTLAGQLRDRGCRGRGRGRGIVVRA